MRSPTGSLDADLTTKARIRQAAIARFGQDGFGASVRAIAADAGVSAALVIKHFGSKDGLRQTCDEAVLAAVREIKTAYVADPGSMTGPVLTAWMRAEPHRPLLLYALRSLQAGGAMARSFIDHMAADAAIYTATGVASGIVKPSRDESARIHYLLLASFGHLMLSVALAPDPQMLTGDQFWQDYLAQILLPVLELYCQGVMTDSTLLDQYVALQADQPVSPSPNST